MKSGLEKFLYKLGLEEVYENKDKTANDLINEVLLGDENLQKSVNDYIENMVKQGIIEQIYNKILDKIDMHNELGVTNEVEKVKEYETIYMDNEPVKILKDEYWKYIKKGKITYDCRIKDILNKTGQKATWLTEKTGIPPSTLSGIINGITSVSLENAYLISIALGKPIEEVFPPSFQNNEK